jgi:hypothetical protein
MQVAANAAAAKDKLNKQMEAEGFVWALTLQNTALKWPYNKRNGQRKTDNRPANLKEGLNVDERTSI